MGFKKASKQQLKARIAISGVSGSGKTFTALALATELAKGNGEKIAFIDTENRSSERYAKDKKGNGFDFQVLHVGAPYTVEKFLNALDDAHEAGFEVIIIDSLSHAWFAVLEKKDSLANSGGKYNSFTAWGPAGKLQEKLIQAILESPAHIIATMRSKTKYAQEEYEENGKKKSKIVKLGMESIQKEGLEYEFDICMEMDLSNTAQVTKSRCQELSGQSFIKPGKEFSKILVNWLESGDLVKEERKIGFGDLWTIAREKLGDDEARKWIKGKAETLGVDPKELDSDSCKTFIEELKGN